MKSIEIKIAVETITPERARELLYGPVDEAPDDEGISLRDELWRLWLAGIPIEIKR